MKFKMPTASRKRLEELLEYLGKTENYLGYYKGNRAEDFKKCFDIESGWCWKYADLLMRGLEKRELGYSEGHHGVPRSFYGAKYGSRKVDSGNWFVLSYGEHMYAHYCAAQCAKGGMSGKMARAFCFMYNLGITHKRFILPTEKEIIDAIPDAEVRRIHSMEPHYAKVEAEGRTHKSEDPVQAARDYYRMNKGRISIRNKMFYEQNKTLLAERGRKYRSSNCDKICLRNKKYYEANKEKIRDYKKTWEADNADRIKQRRKKYYEANKEKLSLRHKIYYEQNKDLLSSNMKVYRTINHDKIVMQQKTYYETNKEKILSKKKEYLSVHRDSKREYLRTYYNTKVAAGYKFRKDPATGKRGWIFVGLHETTKSSEVA